MKALICQVLLSAAAVLSVLPPTAHCDDLTEIIASWSQRAQNVRALHVKWTSQVERFDTENDTHTFPAELALDAAGRYRFQIDNFSSGLQDLSAKRGNDQSSANSPRTQRSLLLYDGKRNVMLFTNTGDFPRAFVGDSGLETIGPDLRLLALRLYYRPFEASLGGLPQSLLRVLPEKAVLDADDCNLIQCGGLTIWVTSDERRLPVRYVNPGQPGKSTSIDAVIEYEADHEHGWRPVRWTIDRIGIDGRSMVQSIRDSVDSLSINSPLADDLCTLDTFPDGTWVTNYISDEVYIAREGRANRQVMVGEYNGSNYEMLKNSEPFWGSTVVRESVGRKWIIVVNLVLLAIVMLAWWRYRCMSARTKGGQ